MERPKKETNLSPDDQELKERLMRSGELMMPTGSFEMSEEYRRLSKTREGRRKLIKKIASSGSSKGIKPGRPISAEFLELPKAKDPEGLLLKALLEDREQGR